MPHNFKIENTFFSKFFLTTVITILSIFALASAIFIALYSFQYNKSEVEKIITRMYEDINYSNGKWDLFLLNSDPLLPGGESHYIITSEGYVIDRWRPITGYLDTSNIDFILEFQTPETFITPTQEQWRMLSAPIKNGNEIVGAVLVSKYIAEEDNMSIIDKRLKSDLDFVLKRTKVNGEQIDLSGLDIRETQYDVSIKVVDKYNTIITKTNNSNSIDRVPNYIDSSYISTELQSNHTKIIFDKVTNEPFLIVISPFQNNNETVGIIIVGKSLSFLFSLISLFLLTILLLVILFYIIWYIFYRRIHTIMSHEIKFDKEKGMLLIDNNRIEIPDNSHQFHIVSSLFKNPNEPQSAEEITSHFGENEGNIWRRVYDAMLIVNKKVEPSIGHKLIIIRNKKFLINPELQSIIQR